MFILKVNNGTTAQQERPKMGQNSIIGLFSAQRATKSLGQRPNSPQELEVGPRSGPYFLIPSTGGTSRQAEEPARQELDFYPKVLVQLQRYFLSSARMFTQR